MIGLDVASGDFEAVWGVIGRQRAIGELLEHKVAVSTADGSEVLGFGQVRAVRGEALCLEPGAGRLALLETHTPVEISCGLADGHYLFEATVDAVADGSVEFRVGPGIHRVQRRRNFRVAVPGGNPVVCRIGSFRDHAYWRRNEANVIDLSVGGALLRWPEGLPEPRIGCELEAVLVFPDGRQVNVQASVRRIVERPDGVRAGVEFTGLKIAESQYLLAVCLQMQRQRLHPD